MIWTPYSGLPEAGRERYIDELWYGACGCTDTRGNCNDGGESMMKFIFYNERFDTALAFVKTTQTATVVRLQRGLSDSVCTYGETATDAGASEYVDPTLLYDAPACGLSSADMLGFEQPQFLKHNPTDSDVDLGYAFQRRECA